jgi:protein disulfide-isomerase
LEPELSNLKHMIKVLILAGLVWNLQAAPAWLTDIEKAKEQAKKESKAILLNFTGSDWCIYCIELKKNVFSKPEFEKFAEKNAVLMVVDFPQRNSQPKKLKAANDQLKEEFKIESFPTIVLLDSEGKELGRIDEYDDETATQFIGKVQALLAKKGKKG